VTGVRILLDEHVGRIFERLLRERGYDVVQAKDEFGEHTDDSALLQYGPAGIETELVHLDEWYDWLHG
jgi:hypothetical protein